MSVAISAPAETMRLIKSHILEETDRKRQSFRNAKPFPHIMLDGFFEEGFCRRLRAEFPAFDAKRAINENGTVGGKATQENLKCLGPSYAEFDALIQSPEFLRLMSDITGIPDLLFDPDYIGGGTHENLHGQDLDTHIDFNYHPTEKWHRRINMLLFLNEEWREEWGGSFELLEDPWLPRGQGMTVSAPPLWNRAIIFETSEKSWHGFPQIRLPEEKRHLSRKSIALYFYTRKRPPEETAVAHSTVYVEQKLPKKIKEGYALTEGDEQKLRQIIDRRDAHIRRLYERERQFSKTIAELKKSAGIPLRGFVEPEGAAEGIWHDQWIGQHFTCHMKTMRPTKTITVVGSLPPRATARPITLTAKIGNGAKEHTATIKQDAGTVTWVIPCHAPAGISLSLSIHVSETWNPRQEGVNEDGRHLGLYLSHIIVE